MSPETIALHQLDMDSQQEAIKQKKQEECIHHFISLPLFDFHHDRIIDVSVCEKCDMEKM